MYLISVCFRKSRTKNDSDKPGVIFYRIARHGQNEPRIERCVNSDIHGTDESIMQTQRDRIIAQIRLLYCVIEKYEEQSSTFGMDDIVNEFRMALDNDSASADVIAKSRTVFPLRRDLVSIGREFKDSFQYVFSNRTQGNGENLLDYVFNLTQNLKKVHRNSQANSFISLQSSLRDFAQTDEIKFSEIDATFICDYAEWLKKRGIVESTQSFYLRTLRSVLNKAQKDGLIEISPDFKDVNTRIYKPTDSNSNTVNREVLLKIENLDLSSNESLALIRDMFMFGFYCEGMELVDIANLTYENIRNNFLVYRRRLKGQEKVVVLGEQAKRIIKRYCRAGQHYLFPLLDEASSIMFSSVSNYVRQYLKTIGQDIGFPKLTFSMNISAYKALISSISISELLLKHGDAV